MSDQIIPYAIIAQDKRGYFEKHAYDYKTYCKELDFLKQQNVQIKKIFQNATNKELKEWINTNPLPKQPIDEPLEIRVEQRPELRQD